jgi:hypothetical protein
MKRHHFVVSDFAGAVQLRDWPVLVVWVALLRDLFLGHDFEAGHILGPAKLAVELMVVE